MRTRPIGRHVAWRAARDGFVAVWRGPGSISSGTGGAGTPGDRERARCRWNVHPSGVHGSAQRGGSSRTGRHGGSHGSSAQRRPEDGTRATGGQSGQTAAITEAIKRASGVAPPFYLMGYARSWPEAPPEGAFSR